MKPSEEQIRRYFEARLDGQRLAYTAQVTVRCPFHDDRQASLSVNMQKGVWRCHAGCGCGGMLDFEMRFSSCDRETATANIAEVTGERQLFIHGRKPEAVYHYSDADGRLLFEKLRYPGKRFAQRKPDTKGGWEYRLGDIQKPLYRLRELLTANYIAVCEGEKDADNLTAAMASVKLPEGTRFSATTNFDGAGKWRDEYAPYFAGKKVVIFPDNDEQGRKHAEQAAHSIHRFAYGVKVVALPNLGEKGDVSDYLQKHPAEQLLAEVGKVQRWFPPKSTRLTVPAPEFVASMPAEVDWLVEGIIERKANGFFCAVPKGGKSWAAVDLALCLTTGCNWLGFAIPCPVTVVLVSREDNPALTAWRIRHLLAAKQGIDFGRLSNLHINTRAQSSQLMLDNPEELSELMQELRTLKPQFVIFDVFNVMHAADENDNTEMRIVLRQLSAIQAEIGCGIGVVHHYSKNETGNLTQRLRGASAIAGWAEWLIGISMNDKERKIRRMDFELKASQPPKHICYEIATTPSGTELRRSDCGTIPERRREGSAAERFMQ